MIKILQSLLMLLILNLFTNPSNADSRSIGFFVNNEPVVRSKLSISRGKVTKYDRDIDNVSKDVGVDPKLIRAIIEVESGFDQSVISPKGAIGLMQLMPSTAKIYGVNPRKSKGNIEAGVRHIRHLLSNYSLEEALACYNAGEGAVAKYGGIPPYVETQSYVTKVISRYRKYYGWE